MNERVRNRRSVRLAGWDYAGDGAYFITVCTYQQVCLFGTVADGEMRLNAAGQAVADCWVALPGHFPRVTLDAWVVMPNHVHGILFVEGKADNAIRTENAEAAVGARHAVPVRGNPDVSGENRDRGNDERLREFGVPVASDLATMIRSFKSAAAREVNRLRGTEGRGVWLRNYYEKIIRNEAMLNGIRGYIADNPARWAGDEFYADEAGWR